MPIKIVLDSEKKKQKLKYLHTHTFPGLTSLLSHLLYLLPVPEQCRGMGNARLWSVHNCFERIFCPFLNALSQKGCYLGCRAQLCPVLGGWSCWNRLCPAQGSPGLSLQRPHRPCGQSLSMDTQHINTTYLG